MPMPGVHKALRLTAISLHFIVAGELGCELISYTQKSNWIMPSYAKNWMESLKEK
jgi:hypothetical protein